MVIDIDNIQQPQKHLKINVYVVEGVPYFRWGDFDVDNDGSQRGFEELCWVIDGVCIQDDQLEGLGQLKDPLYLTLDLRCQQTKERQAVVWDPSPKYKRIYS